MHEDTNIDKSTARGGCDKKTEENGKGRRRREISHPDLHMNILFALPASRDPIDAIITCDYLNIHFFRPFFLFSIWVMIGSWLIAAFHAQSEVRMCPAQKLCHEMKMGFQ